MAKYITIPIDTDPEDLLAASIAYMQSKFPGWQPHDGNLDTAILEATAALASDVRDLATRVPDSIFRILGASLFNLPPGEASGAVGNTTWTAVDTLGHTVVAGTHVGIRNATGDLVAFTVLSDVVIPPGSAATTAGAVPIIAVSPGADSTGLGSIGGPVELIDPLIWVLNITIAGPTSGGVDAEFDDDYLDRLRSQLQLLTPRPILPQDFSVLARTIATVYRAVTIDNYNPQHNYLTLNESDIETSAAGWAVLANTTLAQSATQAQHGVDSLRMTATAGADMSAVIAASKVTVVGETYTAVASFRTAVTARACKVGIQWRDVADAILSTDYGATVNDNAAGWVQPFVTAVAPAGAVKARVVVFVTAPAAAEIHYVDEIQLRHGTTKDWVPGDTIETGNERMVTVVGLTLAGAGVSDPTKVLIETYLDSLREVTFVIHTMDPTITSIKVNFVVTVLEGFSPADVVARATTAVSGYLSPAVWGSQPGDPRSWKNQTVVDRLELATVINNVAGVNGVPTLELAKTGDALGIINLNLPGIVPLATPGVITGASA